MSFLDTVKRNKHYHNLEYPHEQEGDIYLIACGMERCDPGVTYGPEVRDGYHIHAVLSGTGTLCVNGREYHPHFGQLFILKHNEEVKYTADLKDPWEYCWVTYNGSKAKNLTEDIGFTDGVYCLDSTVDVHEFYQLIVRMHERPEMNYINDLRRRGMLLEFLATALEATETKEGRTNRIYEYEPKVYVDQAVDFIHYNYATITVADIIRYVGFSRSYFTTLFKKQIGSSPQEYLLQYRIKIAQELLLTTDQPIQSIAQKVGYENQMTFSRTFKNIVGVSPLKYRETGGIYTE